ncbi:hypothetical protein BJX66DRAFT_5799 [Aspergillus keveii]|uniref:Uncharacterized protein n=1 Tax=Aspergillus keveii TaxID=714993 RepID=A0ABR4GQB9_9EURO
MQTRNPCRGSRRVEFASSGNECTTVVVRGHSHSYSNGHGHAPSYTTTRPYHPTSGCPGHHNEQSYDRYILFRAPSSESNPCGHGHGYGCEGRCGRQHDNRGCCSQSRHHSSCYDGQCGPQCQESSQSYCIAAAAAASPCAGAVTASASATADAQNMSVRATAQTNRGHGHGHGHDPYHDRCAEACGIGCASYNPCGGCGGGCQGLCRNSGQEIHCCVSVGPVRDSTSKCKGRCREAYTYGPPLPVVVDVAHGDCRARC